MRLTEDNLQILRRDVNATTAALASSRMLNEEAAGALMWTLHSTASRAYEELQREQDAVEPEDLRMDNEAGIDDDNDGLPVQPLNLQETVPGRVNPLVFALPFAIAPTQSSSLNEASEALASMCAVAMYNLGLARHTQSFVAKPEEQNTLLDEAKELYLQALDLLDHLQSLTPDGTLIMVYLALCNNLAEVYSQLGDSSESANWQVTLRQSLWTVPPAKNSRVYRHFLNASQSYDIEIFPLAPMDMA